MTETIDVSVKNAFTFLTIAIFTVMAAWTCVLAGIWAVLGNPVNALVDPQTIWYTLSRTQIVMAGLAAIFAAGFTCVGLAATVHAAAEPGIGAIAAVKKIGANGMQIFWLQCVVYALALRFSPWAAVLLWVFAAFTVPVALLENLGPSVAFDRAWELSRGARGRILAMELLLPLGVLAVSAVLVLLAGPRSRVEEQNSLLRFALSWIPPLVNLLPLQLVFVALTRAYLGQAAAPEPPLHAKAASNVK